MSQSQAILGHLKKYGSITALEAFYRYQCLNLKGRMFELRQNHNITSTMIKVGKKRVAQYKLEA